MVVFRLSPGRQGKPMNTFSLNDLSEQQKTAVLHEGSPALVVAGAGSGKTRTLTAKIACLIQQGLASDRILAITFTNKAADEMKNRLTSLTGLPAFRFPWVRTYHSAAYTILKAHCERLGFARPLQVFSAYHQRKAIKEALLRLNYDKKHQGPAQFAISHAKNSGDPLKWLSDNARSWRIRLSDVFHVYERTLRDANAVDFDNILLLTRDLLRDHEDLREKYRNGFHYILVDEYQDSNDLQEELTRLLVKDGRLFCVGDDWQAIYGFRGSNVRHFLTFQKKYPGARLFRLEENYRSRDAIVQAANGLIGFNEDRVEKTCFSRKRGGLVEFLEFDDESREALWVGRKIKTLCQAGMNFDDMAVLYRTKFCSLALEKAFRTQNIPYQMLGGKGFFERKEILDLNCYLMASVFPRDDTAMERVINTPKRGVGPGSLKKIGAGRTDEMSLRDAVRTAVAQKIMSPKLHGALKSLLDLLDAIRSMKPDEALRKVIQDTAYMDHLSAYVNSGGMDLISREENIEELLYLAGQYPTLDEYLEEATLVNEDKKEEDEGAGVRMVTVHGSKGLEFDTVFIIGCEENLMPHWKSMESEEELQEERRLMYVAMTRAEKRLYISSAKYRQGRFNARSRFCDEVEETVY